MTLTDTRRSGIFAIGLTFVALFIANVVGNGADENGGVAYLIVTFAVCAAIAVWMFWRLMPRSVEAGASTSATRALIIAILSALAFPFFWSGLPYVLAPAGIALGLASRARGGGSKATAAVAIAAVALLAAVGVLIGDELDLL
jgi:uncharacterized membrane protein